MLNSSNGDVSLAGDGGFECVVYFMVSSSLGDVFLVGDGGFELIFFFEFFLFEFFLFFILLFRLFLFLFLVGDGGLGEVVYLMVNSSLGDVLLVGDGGFE